MHSAIDIGQAFLDIAKASANGKDKSLTPLQLLKLVYIAHGWMLALNGKPLIKGDVEVWKYGPVIPDLYYKIKTYRRNPITKKISKDFTIDKLTKDEKSVIEETFKVYGKYSAWELSNMTHKIGSPWDKCVDQKRHTIPEYMIQSYYEELSSTSA